MSRTTGVVLGAAFTLVALLLPGGAGAGDATLRGTVGPGFEIALVDSQGVRVTQLAPGPYAIEIQDVSAEHNFHLFGPGVDMRTEVIFEGTVTWNVTFPEGRFTFLCNVHPTTMRGSFVAGNPPPPPPPPPASPPPPPQTRANGTVGPGFTISLRTPAGARVRSLRAGQARITVRDRSRIHNFHLVGPGVNRKTNVPFVGTQTWRIRVRAGATYRFFCDPHARIMRGSFRGRR